ncbi:MAG: hypothetical protein JNN21_03010 [Candidatus Accumulibacter sp.]|nr:hypothetical protein [Accumulibacter sp.]
MDLSLALTWIMFLGLFPLAFFWLRRAWRILFRGDYSEVALKRGEAPPNAERYAPYTAAINLVAGGVAVSVILLVAISGIPYETWTAIAGSTIWLKFFGDFIVSRQARANWGKVDKG